jgi:hypothetical protein
MKVNGKLHASAASPPRKQPHGTHWIGGRLGPRAGPDSMKKKKSLAPSGNRALLFQPVAQSLYWLSYLSFRLLLRLWTLQTTNLNTGRMVYALGHLPRSTSRRSLHFPCQNPCSHYPLWALMVYSVAIPESASAHVSKAVTTRSMTTKLL